MKITLPLWKQILLGMILGAVFGFIIGEHAIYIKPVGELFIRLIKLVIVPLVFTTIVSSITGMSDMNALGRLGLKGFGLYLGTTAFAITIGLAVATLLEPGVGVTIPSLAVKQEIPEAPSIVNMLLNLVPTNPIEAMAKGKILQIIVFAVILGVAINLAGPGGKPIATLAHSAAEVTYKITHIIMYIAPYGVFALIAWIVGTQEPSILLSLIKIIVVVYLGCFMHILFIYGGLLFTNKLSLKSFFKKIIDAQVMAYSTASSAATLPVTMRTAKQKLGISEGTSSFILPMGATVNMDGTALYQGVCVVFVTQAMGIDLSMGEYITVILTATLASIGSASIPSAGLIMLTLVLTSIGLPLDVIALIAGIDRILDMMRTTTNVTGDLTVATVIDKSEEKINNKVFSS